MRVRRKSEITAELQIDGNWFVRDNGAQRYMSPATFAELYEPVPEPPAPHFHSKVTPTGSISAAYNSESCEAPAPHRATIALVPHCEKNGWCPYWSIEIDGERLIENGYEYADTENAAKAKLESLSK